MLKCHEVERNLVFCISKSSEGSRECMESLERNERVCGECPTQMLIPMENPGKKGDCHTAVPFTVFVLELKSLYATLDSFSERFFTNCLSTSVALLLMTLSPNMASFPTMLTSIL
jgi:hypothetical protein